MISVYDSALHAPEPSLVPIERVKRRSGCVDNDISHGINPGTSDALAVIVGTENIPAS